MEKRRQQIVLAVFVVASVLGIFLFAHFFHATGPVCTHVVNVRGVNICE